MDLEQTALLGLIILIAGGNGYIIGRWVTEAKVDTFLREIELTLQEILVENEITLTDLIARAGTRVESERPQRRRPRSAEKAREERKNRK